MLRERKTYRQRLECLREEMRKENMEFFVLANGDGHNSEYVGPYFKLRNAYSGFTGSNGTLVVGLEEAWLWTDGRYFVQAAEELEGSGITLMKSGEKNVPGFIDFLKQKEPKIIGIDGNAVTYRTVERMHSAMQGADAVRLIIKPDLARRILLTEEENIEVFGKWETKKIRVLPESLQGKHVSEKIRQIREELRKKDAFAFFSPRLDSNMWIMNVRGEDIPHNPVAFSYVCVTKESARLFVKENAKSEALSAHCKAEGVVLCSYGDAADFLKEFCGGEKIVAPFDYLSGYFAESLKDTGIQWLDGDCGVSLAQAVKEPKEIEALQEVYRKDSAAVCKFLYWLDRQEKNTITEYNAACRMDELRSGYAGCNDLSFETISAYGSNAAMMHYEPSKQREVFLKEGNVFLLDSGGQYDGGTTDVTRTVAIGQVSHEVKSDYTAVVKGMLALQNAHFLAGCTGMNLDILARAPIWNKNLDYKCGTGHGIGFMLSVHEGPHAIRVKSTGEAGVTEIQSGMIMSDEPGIYKEGKYGIRMENILLCVEAAETPDGRFLEFKPLTLVPIDESMILPEELGEKAEHWLREYQKLVYETMFPYLDEEECRWLGKKCGITDLSETGRNALRYWNAMHNRLDYSKDTIRLDDWLERFDSIIDECTSPVLDLGCGGGNDTFYLLKKGKQVISCDFSEESIRRIRVNFPEVLTALCFDMLEGMPFGNHSFEVIIADLCLHYFRKKDTIRLIEELKRILKPGGHLILRVNSINDTNHGAGEGVEVEPHLFMTRDGYTKRFFDEEDIAFFFRDFETIYVKEESMTRYKLEKRLYRVCVRKK